jgi:MshEN domain
MKTKRRLGELLIQQKIVNQDTVNDALRIQVGGNRRLGHILLQMGALSDDQLATTLSQQLDIQLTNINDTFSPEAKQLLPRYLCTKYGVIPLAFKKNNIMLTAMADPSDFDAIRDIEHYTGKVVEPCLARQSDIAQAITQKIPYSIKDIFNPQANTRLTRTVAAIALILVIGFGVASYNYIQTSKYGSISHLAHSTLYEHHDLMVGFDNSGKISLLGHSAFADGYYSVSFNNLDTLNAFIDSHKNDFSAEQTKWLEWVLNENKSHGTSPSTIARTLH